MQINNFFNKFFLIEGNGAIREIRIMYDLYERDSNRPNRSRAESPSVSTGPKWHPTGILYPWSHPLVQGVYSSDPGYYAEQNILRKYPQSGNNRVKSSYTHSLVRGRPLFAEVDFIPSKLNFKHSFLIRSQITLL